MVDEMVEGLSEGRRWIYSTFLPRQYRTPQSGSRIVRHHNPHASKVMLEATSMGRRQALSKGCVRIHQCGWLVVGVCWKVLCAIKRKDTEEIISHEP